MMMMMKGSWLLLIGISTSLAGWLGVLCLSAACVNSFGIVVQPSVRCGGSPCSGLQQQQQPQLGTTHLSASSSSNEDKGDANDNNNDNSNNYNNKDKDFRHALEARVDEIQIAQTREQLEQAHTQSFLKRKPRKLPYEDARIWVQANLGADTKEEFMDLVANGNLRTPYIPKQPEQYYTETREWVSWEHFLRGCFDNRKVSSIKPSTGIFD